MIIKCNSNWKETIEKYIGKYYPECLYLFLDFKKYGFDYAAVNIWVQQDEDDITAVILKYYTGMHVFSQKNNFCKKEIVELIQQEKPDMICGRKDVLERISSEEYMGLYFSEFGYVGVCKEVKNICSYPVQKASSNDFKQIVNLLYQDEGIGASYNLDDLSEQMLERNKQGFVRNVVIKDAEKVVCHVCTGAEEGVISVISGIVTDNGYRGRGLAASLLSYTCHQLLSEGKEVYSIYYTIPATQLHHRVGFVDYCQFGKLFVKKH